MALKSAKNDNWSSPEANKYNVSGKNQDFYSSEKVSGVQVITSGGTKIETATEFFHVFTGSEPFDNDGVDITVDVLMIGGGGGTTSSAWSGGGGAGGYRLVPNVPVASGSSSPMIIGAGTGAPQTIGGQTTGFGYVIVGGGRGGPAHTGGNTSPQGSGGGGGGPDNGYPPWGGGAGGSGSYGNPGGPAGANSQGPSPGGGGGGIGGAGRPTSYPSPNYAPWHWAQYPSNGGGVGGPGAHPAEPTFPMSVIAPAFPGPTSTFLTNPNSYDSFCRGGCGRPRSGYGVAQGFANTGGGSGGNDAGFGGSGCIIVRISKTQ